MVTSPTFEAINSSVRNFISATVTKIVVVLEIVI